MEKLKIHMDEDEGAVCTFGPVIFVVWRTHDSVAPFDHADAAIEAMAERYGEGRNLFYVHRAPHRKGMHRSDAAVRARSIEHFERHDLSFFAAALAIEAEGFAGSVLRSISAGVMLVRRTKVKTESFRDARDGVRWLGELALEVNPFNAEEMVRQLQRAGLTLDE